MSTLAVVACSAGYGLRVSESEEYTLRKHAVRVQPSSRRVSFITEHCADICRVVPATCRSRSREKAHRVFFKMYLITWMASIKAFVAHGNTHFTCMVNTRQYIPTLMLAVA